MAEIRYVARPILKIDGKQAPDDLMEDILQISVEESLHLPGMFTLVIQNAYAPGREQDKPWKHKDLFAIGKPITIGFGSSTTDSQEFAQKKEGNVLEGEITAMETHFTSGSQAPMIIRGYDVAHRLHRGRYNRSFQNMTDSDIVEKIAKEVGIEFDKGKIENSGAPHDYLFQENQTNMEFLRERAARIGFELFIQDGQLNFRKPSKVGDPLALKWLKDLHSFRVRVSSAEQVSEVEVRGWDYTRKRPIVETANAEKVLTATQNGQGSKTSSSFKNKPAKPKMIVVDQPIFTRDEAKTMAQSLCNELGGEFVLADAKGEGNPEIRPGRVVKLEDMGSYSGEYYITDTRHFYHEGVYHTEFSIRGLRGGNLFTTLSPKTRLQPGQTFLVGIVTDNKDPKGWGRVKVKFPTLTEEHASDWARVVAIGAGPKRGFDCLPEVNDEVLVAFEHGDIHRPYVLGGVWNGTDAPPEAVNNSVVNGVRLRTFKTRTGHQLQFVEEDKGGSKDGVHVETSGGHQLQMNDSDTKIGMTSTGDIGIKSGRTGMSNKISLNAGEIDLTGITKITLTVGANTIELTQAGITIRAAGPLNLQGLPIKLN